MKISILQLPSKIGNTEYNISLLKSSTAEAMKNNPDVLVLPELWNTGYYPAPVMDFAEDKTAPSYQAMKELAIKYQVNVVGGSIIFKDKTNAKNTCFVFNRHGEEVGRYDKTHLFSYAEENLHFQAGSQLTTFELDGVKCGVLICYDIRFPEAARHLALSDVNVLFLPAAWPAERSYHWNTLTRARAIENQIFLCAANCYGHSAILDPWGMELSTEADAKSSSDDIKIITAEIDLSAKEKIRQTINVFRDRRPELY